MRKKEREELLRKVEIHKVKMDVHFKDLEYHLDRMDKAIQEARLFFR